MKHQDRTHNSGDILSLARQFCVSFLKGGRCGSLPFHNAQHTLEVFDHVRVIGRDEGLSEKALELALLAALFHDVGNASGFEGHEAQSNAMATKFLEPWKYPKETLQTVQACIMATRMPQSPNTLLEKILCDADLFHLGTVSFFSKNALLREEWQHFHGWSYTERDWVLLNISFLEEHRYFTAFGQRELEPVKQQHLATLRGRLDTEIINEP
ncbi:HD domain-containing protein [Flagellimonas iocasae]|uniref:HD domain-containing protein n=1 Tax=Flagellimonas iocasae TaxID=2055905 RepID=A0ABW4XVJ0_9FLAO